MFWKSCAGAIAVSAILLTIAGGGVAHAGGGCHQGSSAKLTDEEGTHVRIADCAFSPTVIRAAPGEYIEWLNEDKALHTVTGAHGSWGDFAEYANGESVTYAFAEPGVYPYFCELHPGMVGAVVVGDGLAVTGSGGGAVSALAPGGSDGQGADSPENADNSDGPGVAGFAVIGTAVAVVGAAGALAIWSFARRRRSQV